MKEASRLYKRLAKTLEADQVKLCFEGEELACDREQMIFYLPVDMDLEEWEAGTFSNVDDSIEILPMKDYTLLDKQETVAQIAYSISGMEPGGWNLQESVCGIYRSSCSEDGDGSGS